MERSPQVAWFDVDSVDMYNLRAHLEQTPAQLAYIGEQYAEKEKIYQDAKDYYDQTKSRKIMEARTTPQYRVNKLGEEDTFNMTDTLAGKWADQTPEVIHAAAAVNIARYERDRWSGYRDAMSKKASFLLVLGGMSRDELNIINSMR